VPKENQVGNYLELDNSLVRVELFILLLLSLPVGVLGRSYDEGIVLSIVTLKVDLLLVNATPEDMSLKLLD
jgi:hypothetical protein